MFQGRAFRGRGRTWGLKDSRRLSDTRRSVSDSSCPSESSIYQSINLSIYLSIYIYIYIHTFINGGVRTWGLKDSRRLSETRRSIIENSGTLDTNPKHIAREYLKGWFSIDVASTVPARLTLTLTLTLTPSTIPNPNPNP